MDKNLEYVEQMRLERTKAALEKNGMQCFVVQSAAEVVPLLARMLTPGAVVSNGGSMSLCECGVMEFLRSGAFDFLDREASGVDQQALYRDVFGADVYLASANAVTENGEVYQIDGNGNRVAAIAFGPRQIILVAGRNKIVKDLDAARLRRAQVAGPANAKRVGVQTPCSVTGACTDCKSPGRICCTELVLHQQRNPDRIKIILVNEELGY